MIKADVEIHSSEASGAAISLNDHAATGLRREGRDLSAFPILLQDADVEVIWGIPKGTLQANRCRKRGPRYFKIGASVYMKAEDIEAWLETKAVGAHAIVFPPDGVRLTAALIDALRPIAKEITDNLDDPPPDWARMSDAGKLLDLLGLIAERISIMAEGAAA